MIPALSKRRIIGISRFLLFLLILTACAPEFSQSIDRQRFPEGLFDPTDVRGVELPEGYLRSWGRDQLAPVYDPTFITAEQVPWDDDEVIIGVNINGQQRAYPVGFLSSRELVIDQIDDIPILVSW